LRGREAVRADRRLRTDEKHIRTQSAILYNPKTAFAFIQNRVYRADALFIRSENTVGARSAQLLCIFYCFVYPASFALQAFPIIEWN
jgi:hypothetical protein